MMTLKTGDTETRKMMERDSMVGKAGVQKIMARMDGSTNMVVKDGAA